MNFEAYDPDRLDAEIILDRFGYSAPYTAQMLAKVFKCSRSNITTAKARGRIPRPAVEGNSIGARSPDEWTTEQVIEMMLSGFRSGVQRGTRSLKPIPHGTYKGSRMHLRRGVLMCKPCREAERQYRREWKAKARAAA